MSSGSPAPGSRGAASPGVASRSAEQGAKRDCASGRSAHPAPVALQLAASVHMHEPASSPARHAGTPSQPHPPPVQTEWACLKNIDGEKFPISTQTDEPFNIGREPGGREHSLQVSAPDAIMYVSRRHCSILKTRTGTSAMRACPHLASHAPQSDRLIRLSGAFFRRGHLDRRQFTRHMGRRTKSPQDFHAAKKWRYYPALLRCDQITDDASFRALHIYSALRHCTSSIFLMFVFLIVNTLSKRPSSPQLGS